MIGIGYALSWIAGLSIPAPSPPLSASGAEITAALAGHGTAVAAQFTLTEGLPAAGLAVVSLALARAARRGRPGRSRGRPGGCARLAGPVPVRDSAGRHVRRRHRARPLWRGEPA